MKELLAYLTLIVLMIVIVFGAAFALDSSSCHASWRDSGYPVRYSFMGGCRISRDNGRTWIPADALRTIQ